MSCSGLNVISPITIESGECSVNCVEPLFSVNIYKKAGESPWASLMSFEMPMQVARGPGWSSKVRVQAVNGGSCLPMCPMPPTSLALPIQEVHHTGVLVVSPHQGGVSPVGVSGWIESLSMMVFRLNFDRNSILGSNLLLGGLISKGKRTVTLVFVSRLVGPSFPVPFLEVVQAGALGFGVLG